MTPASETRTPPFPALFPDLDDALDVEGERCARLEVPHDGNGVRLLQDALLVQLQDGQGEPEQNLGSFQQEAVPDPNQRLKTAINFSVKQGNHKDEKHSNVCINLP